MRNRLMVCLNAMAQCAIICLPTVLFQLLGWQSFCQNAAQLRPWCLSIIPNIYSFVQSHYWNVGLFRYYKTQQVHDAFCFLATTHLMSALADCLKILLSVQIPNFLLATPMLCLSVAMCWKFKYHRWRWSLSTNRPFVMQESHAESKHTSSIAADTSGKPISCCQTANTAMPNSQQSVAMYRAKQQGFMCDQMDPYIVHLGFLTATAALVMNIQVVTRYDSVTVAGGSCCNAAFLDQISAT